MAAMTTALVEFSDKENSRTWFASAYHSVVKAMLVIQKRRVPTGNQTVLEDVITVVAGTEDGDGNPHPQKISFEVKVRRPIDAFSTDRVNALSIFRDIVAGDEFGNVVTTQRYIKD